MVSFLFGKGGGKGLEELMGLGKKINLKLKVKVKVWKFFEDDSKLK